MKEVELEEHFMKKGKLIKLKEENKLLVKFKENKEKN